MKRFMLLLMLFSASITSFAQAQATPSFWTDPFTHPLLPLYALTFFIFLVLILVVVVALYLLRVINILVEQGEREKKKRLGEEYIPAPSLLSTWWQKMNASVPLTEEKNIDIGHSYDGIRELDNHLPPWWKWLFYGTVVWAVVYLLVFHLYDVMPLSIEEYNQEITLAEEQMQKLKASQPQEAVDENTLSYSADVAILEKGKAIFKDFNCGSCHRQDGGGNTIGPNLADEYWLHGGQIKDIFNTINKGYIEKGMPAWGKSMSPQDVKAVAFFVMSLQGSNPENPKAPQGELVKPASPVPTDSTAVQASL